MKDIIWQRKLIVFTAVR